MRRSLHNGFIVFVRLDGLELLAADTIAARWGALFRVGRELVPTHDEEAGITVRNSLSGQFFVVPADPARAIELGRAIRDGCARRGVPVGIGISGGAMEQFSDPAGDNNAGGGINTAARLASAQAGPAMQVRVDLGVADLIRRLSSRWAPMLEGRASVVIKGRSLVFVSLDPGVAPQIGPPPRAAADTAIANVVIADLVAFSRAPTPRQSDRATLLKRLAVRALQAVPGVQPRFAPGGDGGAWVFGVDEAAAAWTFVQALGQLRGDDDLHLSLTSGPVAFVDDGRGNLLPVGPAIVEGVLLAERAEALPNDICVGRSYWEAHELEHRHLPGFRRRPLERGAGVRLCPVPAHDGSERADAAPTADVVAATARKGAAAPAPAVHEREPSPTAPGTLPPAIVVLNRPDGAVFDIPVHALGETDVGYAFAPTDDPDVCAVVHGDGGLSLSPSFFFEIGAAKLERTRLPAAGTIELLVRRRTPAMRYRLTVARGSVVGDRVTFDLRPHGRFDLDARWSRRVVALSSSETDRVEVVVLPGRSTPTGANT